MACLSYIKTDYEREKLVYKADPSDVSFLHDGICGFGRNCLQLCEVGFRIDGFRSEYLSFFSVLLVSDLFRPDGNVDELDRAEKDGHAEPSRYLRVVADPMFRRWLYGDVGLFFFIRDRECFDADLSEPASL